MDFRITFTGTDALLMHSARLANPLDPAAKAVKRLTSKKLKTDDDYASLARVEWAGGMYFDSEIGPYIPGDNIWRAIYDGSRKQKKGPRVKEGVLITTNINPLQYTGPRDQDHMWQDENFRHHSSVKVGTSRTTRCRPHFRSWTVDANGIVDTSILDVEELRQIADIAGSIIGLGDWRPRFGRFTAAIEAA